MDACPWACSSRTDLLDTLLDRNTLANDCEQCKQQRHRRFRDKDLYEKRKSEWVQEIPLSQDLSRKILTDAFVVLASSVGWTVRCRKKIGHERQTLWKLLEQVPFRTHSLLQAMYGSPSWGGMHWQTAVCVEPWFLTLHCALVPPTRLKNGSNSNLYFEAIKKQESDLTWTWNTNVFGNWRRNASTFTERISSVIRLTTTSGYMSNDFAIRWNSARWWDTGIYGGR